MSVGWSGYAFVRRSTCRTSLAYLALLYQKFIGFIGFVGFGQMLSFYIYLKFYQFTGEKKKMIIKAVLVYLVLISSQLEQHVLSRNFVG